MNGKDQLYFLYFKPTGQVVASLVKKCVIQNNIIIKLSDPYQRSIFPFSQDTAHERAEKSSSHLDVNSCNCFLAKGPTESIVGISTLASM